MKKVIYSIMAACAMLSCNKQLDVKETPIKFAAGFADTASVNTSKTTVSSEGKVAWVIGDLVTISDGTNEGTYKVASVGDKRKANLEYVSGVQFTSAGTYSATYGNDKDQWYIASAPGSNCPMYADGVSASSGAACTFYFKNSDGVVSVQANTGELKISSIKVGDYVLNFANPLALDGSYPVAVKGGEAFSKVVFTQADGTVASVNITSTSVPKNGFRTLPTGSYFANASKYKDFNPLALPGKFTINSGLTQVQFANGNLWKDASGGYHTEVNQYIGVTTYSASHLAYFDPRTSIWDVPESITKLGWRTMTSDELSYIVGNARGITDLILGQPLTYCCCRVTEGDKDKYVGMLMFPDNFKWDTTLYGSKPTSRHGNNDTDVHQLTLAQFENLCNVGVVFFAKTGYYWGGTVSYTGRGQYLYGSVGSNKGSRNFQYAQWNGYDGSNYNCAVRLVKEVAK